MYIYIYILIHYQVNLLYLIHSHKSYYIFRMSYLTIVCIRQICLIKI